MLNSNLQWIKMKIKASKSRSLPIVRGKVVDRRFALDENVVHTVLENPLKSLGRWYNASLSVKAQCVELKVIVILVVRSIAPTNQQEKVRQERPSVSRGTSEA